MPRRRRVGGGGGLGRYTAVCIWVGTPECNEEEGRASQGRWGGVRHSVYEGGCVAV